jgi:hypothetical protein
VTVYRWACGRVESPYVGSECNAVWVLLQPHAAERHVVVAGNGLRCSVEGGGDDRGQRWGKTEVG